MNLETKDVGLCMQKGLKNNLIALYVEKYFEFKPNCKLLEHRRKYHTNSVKTCRSLSTGSCKYGKSKCWFNHNESADTNEGVIEIIFKLMIKLSK